jgi:hypothetical protein
MSKLFHKACIPLYEVCPTNCLDGIILLFNLITTHGVSNTFVDEFFPLLKFDLFPKDNTLPKSMYHMLRG